MAPEHFLHQRVAEALRKHPPFSELDGEELLVLAEHVEVHYLPDGKWLFAYGDPLADWIYVVAQNTVELWRGGDLIDHVEPGELMGLRSLFGTGTYQAGARASSGKDALVYALPLELVRRYLVNNPDTEHFFQLDWKGNSEDFVPSGTSLRRLMKRRESPIVLPITDQNQRLHLSPALCRAPEEPLYAIAEAMTGAHADAAVIVDAQMRPVGIITDRDMRRVIARPDLSTAEPASNIMTRGVKTYPPSLSYGDAMMAMVEKKIHHLVITEDGTDATAVVGLVSDHELLLEQALNPSILVKRTERAADVEELARVAEKIEQLRQNYIRANVSTAYLLKIMTSFYTGLYAAALRLAEAELGTPPCGYAWVALGSLGRGEQLVRTDQDHALVYAYPGVDRYFETLARRVSGIMQDLGFAEDHYGVSATGALWRGTPEEWESRLEGWMREGEGEALMRLSIIQDARVVAGDLGVALPAFNHLYRRLGADQGLLLQLAKDALRSPSPLNFFKQFKVNDSGQFDLKLRAILPFIDAAKVLAAHAGKSHISSTTGRLQAIIDQGNEALITSAVHAYEILLDLRMKFALRSGTDGRYIQPEELDQIDKQLLRNVLKTLEALQAHLKLKFKL